MSEETKMIDLNKKYKYRCGHEPDAVFYDGSGMLSSVHGIHAFYHHDDGSVNHPAVREGGLSERDLIEISPYDDWEMDAPIVAWNTNKEFGSRCHFAGISENGKPLAHSFGMTSFTNTKNYTVEWQHAELWEGDDD